MPLPLEQSPFTHSLAAPSGGTAILTPAYWNVGAAPSMGACSVLDGRITAASLHIRKAGYIVF